MNHPCTRRQALRWAAAVGGSLVAPGWAVDPPRFRLAPFSADVTIPVGHPCMAGGIAPAREIVDPLFVHGFVLLGEGLPLVVAAVDWCEIRNDAYEQWRLQLAKAAGTVPARVLVSSVHQHDAPVADLEAERLLRTHKAAGSICDLEFHERTVARVARAIQDALAHARPVSHYGVGQAKVEKVASNRRYLGPDGKPRFNRMSATRDPAIRDQPEGLIDPWLKTLSFWDGDRPVAALSCYATHPMSYYGQGGVSADFVGLARRRRQADEPTVLQIYASGCSGNVTAGKFNDGSPAQRPVLAERIYQAMLAAWQATRRHPLQRVVFRRVPYRLEPRNDAGFTVADLQAALTMHPRPFGQCLAALGLSWRKRVDAGQQLDLPVLDLGGAVVCLLPGEAYVEYQLLAQRLRPDDFVIALGYGECATGYVPTDQAFAERDSNLRDWCWVAPGSEKILTRALEQALRASD
ncbi:MAG: hypothetical protein NZ700_12975 [Gemmataceae bacterium]|nr:hypothetical protein [Gemmataceae bacterium]